MIICRRAPDFASMPRYPQAIWLRISELPPRLRGVRHGTGSGQVVVLITFMIILITP
jgi:hypothetical protein